MDGRPQRADDGERVHPLPEQVRRIDVRADDRTDRLAQPQQRRDVVDEVQRMQLEREAFDAVGERVGAEVLPELDRRRPLTIQQRHRVGRPRIPGEVDRGRARAVARVARHRHDLADAQLAGQADGRPDELDVPLAVDRVERPGRAVERGDAQAAAGERLGERCARRPGRRAAPRSAGAAPTTGRRWRSRSRSRRCARPDPGRHSKVRSLTESVYMPSSRPRSSPVAACVPSAADRAGPADRVAIAGHVSRTQSRSGSNEAAIVRRSPASALR